MHTNKKILLLTAAVLHVFFICQKSFRDYVPFDTLKTEVPALMAISEYYTELAVMQADYSFFSPNISPDYELSFDIQQPGGHWVKAFISVPNNEVQKRLHSCLLGIQRIPADLQQIIAKSWAARVLDEHPEAEFIQVTVTRQKQSSLDNYRKGISTPKEIVLNVLFETHKK
jgi:hypothetical protein